MRARVVPVPLDLTKLDRVCIQLQVQPLPSILRAFLIFHTFPQTSLVTLTRTSVEDRALSSSLSLHPAGPTMLKTIVPRAGRSLLASRAPQAGPSNLRLPPSFQIVSQSRQQRRGYASEAPDYDVVFIGGGVAGYVGAIKAGQEGLKVRRPLHGHDIRS